MTDDDMTVSGEADAPEVVEALDRPTDPAANPLDAWLAEAPERSSQDLCPWCSAPLDPASPATCPACGARLTRGGVDEIPGVTVVDPATLQRTAPRPVTGTGLVGWLTGDADLIAAAREDAARTQAARSGAAAAPGPQLGGTADMGATPPDAVSAALGPASPEAVAPPGARLRLEMARLTGAAAPLDGAEIVEAGGESADTADDAEAPGGEAGAAHLGGDAATSPDDAGATARAAGGEAGVAGPGDPPAAPDAG